MKLNKINNLKTYIKQLEHDIQILKLYADNYFKNKIEDPTFPTNEIDTNSNHYRIINLHTNFLKELSNLKNLNMDEAVDRLHNKFNKKV